MNNDSDNHDVENLLELHHVTSEVGSGYWVTMRAKRVEKDDDRPHGIQYSLTLHKPGGERILGYDNAHKPELRASPARRSKLRDLPFDHRHYRERVTPYEFNSAGDLLEDFWRDVEKILEEEGVS